MTEEEEDNKRHELKTKRRDLTGYDDEFVSGQAGMKRAVLANMIRISMERSLGPNSMGVDGNPAATFTRRESNLDAKFVADDELQRALVRSRRSKTRKINKLAPEGLAKRGT
ncbi:unnamed protein product [Rhizoctonia solani]|uniref:Uncharacterized protein n=1 Tax=Rhizoctonia solani TaxID=456999 RepID=A0A8H3EA74_9AGAM|nr:unnamed protein product [Rhizoctonia solani]